MHDVPSAPTTIAARVWPTVWRDWRYLFSLNPAAASFDVRGFRIGDPAARAQFERIGEVFIAGYNRALRAADAAEMQNALDEFDPNLRGFAVEGAAMACAIVDALTFRGHRLRAWVNSTAREFTYLTHVGAGWALARVPWRRRAILDCLDPIHCWLAFDGLGFHDAYFQSRRITSGWRRLRTGYGARTYDQGVGRAIWFIGGGSVEHAIELIFRLDPLRHSDLWAGFGLALAYAGGATPDGLRRAVAAAGPALPSLAQGAVFAAEAKARGGYVPAYTRQVVRILSGLEVEQAVRVVRCVRTSLPHTESGGTPRYELWRRDVQEALGRVGVACHA